MTGETTDFNGNHDYRTHRYGVPLTDFLFIQLFSRLHFTLKMQVCHSFVS